ncbi:MAG: protein kinase [Pseudomonadota bacterium]
MSTKTSTPPHESGQDTVFDPLIESAAGTGRALVPGTMLEEYEVQRVLSESGFAVVYLAMDHAFDRLVVIKEYQPSTLAEHSEKSRAELRGQAHATSFKRGKYAFMSESRMLASCDHPSLLRVNRIWDANGTVYRVMPYYYGKSLQVTRQAAPQAPDEASLRSLLDGLLGALAALHEQDCVHGAVSPDNILLLADDRPVLMDFGAVRRAIVSPETQRLIAMLEPSYLPMEQIEPAPPQSVPGPWSDLYSVAAVLYFCICGELPKRAKREPIAVAARRLQQRQPGLQYSAALLHTIDACLAENPNDRPQSVAEFRRLLDTPRVMGAEAPAPVTSTAGHQGASFPASDDMVNVQGRVVPFARRKETGSRPTPLGSSSPSAASAQASGLPPGAFDAQGRAPAPGEDPALAAVEAQASAAGLDDTDAPAEGRASRFFPSLEEMMAESDDRVAADMRRERAHSAQFSGHGPIRPQASRWAPRVGATLMVLLVLAGLGFGGWKLNQQRLADELLGSVGGQQHALEPTGPFSSSRTAAVNGTLSEPDPAAFPNPAPLAETSARSAGAGAQPLAAAEAERRNNNPPSLANATPNPVATGRSAPVARSAVVTPTREEPAPSVDAREPVPEPVSPVKTQPAPARAEPAAEIRVSPSAGRVATAQAAPDLVPPPPVKPVREPLTPREACGERTDFALYNCMQTQCARGRWSASLQCQRLRDTDEVFN